jgi:photosystem II stability/assembly factor-like uncharacterized protein
MSVNAVGVGLLRMTRDGGQTWAGKPAFGVGDSIYQVIFLDERYGWVAARSGIWRTTDSGDTWERLALGQ